MRDAMSQAFGMTAMIPPVGRQRQATRSTLGMTREWSWLLALVVVDALWCWRIGMTFSQPGDILLVMAVPILACLGCRWFRRTARLADACEAVGFWIGFMVAGCILTYLFAAWAFPLRDVQFDRFDAALGFDWLAWKHFVLAHPPLHRLLALVYAAFKLEVLLVVVYFALAGRRRCNDMLLRAAFISLMITTVVSGFVPALGPFSLYGMPEQAHYLHDLMTLRSGHDLMFVLPQLKGIITLPSYHAVLAVLLAWSLRRGGVIGITMVSWNLLMLVSVMSEGGHYLVDAIVGVGVAALSLWLARASLPQAESAAGGAAAKRSA
jgi:hypothetical protein